MSRKTLELSDSLYAYLLDHSLREPAELKRLRQETALMDEANMQIAPDQGQFMQLLLRLMGATRCLEVGVFTGYSTLATALALPEEGRIIACDLSEDWTQIARKYWRQAGVEHKIDLRLAPALDTLDGLIEEGRNESFDFAFIDADKANYPHYFDRCMDLVRVGGLIAFDNTLWAGTVADDSVQDDDTRAIRELNQRLHQDDRIELSLVPIGDGLSLARKR